MVNFFDIGVAMMDGLRNFGKPAVHYAVFESNMPSEVKGTEAPKNMLSVFTASKILSSAISQMDILITKDNTDYKDFEMYYELKYRMNEIQNNQIFFSTLEFHRNIYGNAFVDLRKGRNEIIHPSLVADYDYKGVRGSLRFFIAWSSQENALSKKRDNKRSDEWVNARDLLHFKGMSVDGVFGLPPVSAAAQAMGILDKASNTIDSFYKNRALSPMALESTIDSAAAAKATLEGLNTFNAKYQGTYNAGKTMQLPPNTKLTPLTIQFRDAELIGTMRFSREEIMQMYGIPTYLWSPSDTIQSDIEQQTLSFKTFTLAPIMAIYRSELEYKLLSKQEVLNGVEIELDAGALLVADLTTKANSYRSLVTAGIMTPNQAAIEMGLPKTENEWMDKHYIQSQNISIEDYNEFGKFNDLATKSINTNNKQE